MNCPICENNTLKVVDSASDDKRVIRRRRCTLCGQTFYSEETLCTFKNELAKDMIDIKQNAGVEVFTPKKFVLVNGGYNRHSAATMMNEVYDQVCEVLQGRMSIKRDAIVTENLIVRFVCMDDNYYKLQADEVFGFDDYNTWNLRKDHKLERFDGTVAEYILRNA